MPRTLTPPTAPTMLALSALLLGGCVTAGGETAQALDEALVANGYVEEINIAAAEDSGVSGEFAQALSAEMEEQLAACATGDSPLRLDVTLSRIKRANPVVSAVVTDTNQMAGHVQLYSLESGAPVGEYDVEWQNRGGIGAGGAAMALVLSESQMIGGFSRELCRRIFTPGAEEDATYVSPF